MGNETEGRVDEIAAIEEVEVSDSLAEVMLPSVLTGVIETATVTIPMTLAEFKECLTPFLSRNPLSTVEEIDRGPIKSIAIRKPWGDQSVAIFMPDDIGPFVAAMNELHLPERYTAIWHADTKDLEVIWTAFQLNPSWHDVKDRSFIFAHNAIEYQCEFGLSSDRLKLIAENVQPLSASATNHRNMLSFTLHFRRSLPGLSLDTTVTDSPRSFWIRNVEWNPNAVLDLVMHLNFYMVYYDTQTPEILIHSPSTQDDSFLQPDRYIIGEFPRDIRPRQVDNNLLHFWRASRSGDSARKFQYLYRIVEYAASFHLDSSVRATIKKHLSSPHALSDLNVAIEYIITALPQKADDGHLISAILRDTVEIKLFWNEVSRNIRYFDSMTTFDGGYQVRAMVTKSGNAEAEFLGNGIDKVASALRGIRNALAHGREQKSKDVILPTEENFERLRPWVLLAQIAAQEVMVYRYVT